MASATFHFETDSLALQALCYYSGTEVMLVRRVKPVLQAILEEADITQQIRVVAEQHHHNSDGMIEVAFCPDSAQIQSEDVPFREPKVCAAKRIRLG